MVAAMLLGLFTVKMYIPLIDASLCQRNRPAA